MARERPPSAGRPPSPGTAGASFSPATSSSSLPSNGGGPPPPPPNFSPTEPGVNLASGIPGSSLENQFQLLAALTSQGGLDPSALLGSTDKPSSLFSSVSSPPPGFGTSSLKLSENSLTQLGAELSNLLDDYDRVMDARTRLEEDINAAYAQRSDARQAGTQPGDARMVSELTTYIVDQLTARLSNNVRGVTPLARCEVIFGAEGVDYSLNMAQAAEHFLQAYGERVIKLPIKLSQAIHRAVKVGTAVFRVSWTTDKRRIQSYTQKGKKATRVDERSRIRLDLIPNRHVKIWPPTIWDWQEDYLFVGHDSFLTRDQWRTQSSRLKLSEKLRDEVEATAGWDRDTGEEKSLNDQDIARHAMAHRQDELIRWTELYLHMTVPGQDEPDFYQVFLSRPLRRIVWIDLNRNHEQDHCYFPIRYKYVDESAWGNGAGHEILYPQASGSSMLNIEMDSLLSSCYHFVVCKPDFLHIQQTTRPLMGQRVPSTDPTNDYIPRKLGGPVPELSESKQNNEFRAMRLSGVPPVLGGMGDPIQKSGTGTGSTQMLITEAGKKHGYTDQTMRDDIAPLLTFILKMVAQYAPDGLVYEYASPQDANRLQLMTYLPPRAEIGQLFRISVQAPNAATSKEGRRQAWLMLYQFIRDHLMVWGQQAAQLLQTENPAAIQRLMHEILEFQAWLVQQLLEDYELPGAKEKLPLMPKPIPPDEVINQQQQQISQYEAQLQKAQEYTAQLTQQLQMLMSGGGMMGGMNGGMMGNGMMGGMMNGGMNGSMMGAGAPPEMTPPPPEVPPDQMPSEMPAEMPPEQSMMMPMMPPGVMPS